jgi:hypothetical protein
MKKCMGILIVAVFCTGLLGEAEASSLEPFSQKLTVQAKAYSDQQWTKVPLITWGADIVTVHANGGSAKTSKDSAFGQAGLQLELFR